LGKEELYKFVRDRHDKMIAARAMSQTRLGQLLVFTGFIVAGTTSFGIPQIVSLRQNLAPSVSAWFIPVLTLALISTVIGLSGIVYHALKMIFHFTFELPRAPKDDVLLLMERKELDKDQTLEGLTSLYLSCIEANEIESAKTGNQFRKGFRCLCVTLVLSAVFAILVLVGNGFLSFKKPGDVDMSNNQPSEPNAQKSSDSNASTSSTSSSKTVSDTIRSFGTGKITASEDPTKYVTKSNQGKSGSKGE
jgi:hypothetical protein